MKPSEQTVASYEEISNYRVVNEAWQEIPKSPATKLAQKIQIQKINQSPNFVNFIDTSPKIKVRERLELITRKMKNMTLSTRTGKIAGKHWKNTENDKIVEEGGK